MADYVSAHRTSYFRVTDEDAYEKLCKGLVGVDEFFSKEKPDGLYHGFGGFQPAQYSIPPSQNDEIAKRLKENKPIYKIRYRKGTPYGAKAAYDLLPLTPEELAKINSDFDELYDENGKCIYERWDDIADLDSDDGFISKLQRLLHPDDAFVYIESGHEKLRYVSGSTIIATRDNMKYMSLDGIIESTIKEFLGDDKSTEYTY